MKNENQKETTTTFKPPLHQSAAQYKVFEKGEYIGAVSRGHICWYAAVARSYGDEVIAEYKTRSQALWGLLRHYNMRKEAV